MGGQEVAGQGCTGSPSPQPFPALCVTAAAEKGLGTAARGGAAAGGEAGPRAGRGGRPAQRQSGAEHPAPRRGGPAVASGPYPGPATEPGKGLSETSRLMQGRKCCLGGGCALEDARGAGTTSPSPLGALGLAPEATRLGVPGGQATGPALPLLPSASPDALGWERLPEVVGAAQSLARLPQPQPQQVRGLGRSRPPEKETRIDSGTRDTCRGHKPSGGRIPAPRYCRSAGRPPPLRSRPPSFSQGQSELRGPAWQAEGYWAPAVNQSRVGLGPQRARFGRGKL